MNTKKPLVICTTLLIENSPQALPLGAACIASAIKKDARTKDKFSVELRTLSREESGYPERQPEEFIAAKITGNDAPDYVCFSVYVWNRNELEETAALLKKRFPSLITIAGGPEVTASPQSFKNFDWCVAGEGECAVPELLFFLEKQK
ncbi:MAG: cobalamin-dependent protein, partial [Treponema porcinum]|nr:cobalamin-dependent protein [Treponema porcinum]